MMVYTALKSVINRDSYTKKWHFFAPIFRFLKPANETENKVSEDSLTCWHIYIYEHVTGTV